MLRYRIYHETRELSKFNLKRADGDFINACASEGMLNGSYDVLGEYGTMEEARKALTQYKCGMITTQGFATSFFSCDLYWFEEEEYDEDYDTWEFTGNSEFAKPYIEEKEED